MARGPGVSRHLTVRDVRIHYVDWPGEGPTILLLHPNRTNSRVWDFVVANSTLRNRFVAVDHRGHGLSDWPETGYALEEYVADDVALIEALGSPVVLMAAATGGTVGLLLASERPDLVSALGVLDPGLSLDPSINERVQEQIEREYVHDSFEAGMAAMPFSDRWDDAMRAHFAAASLRRLSDGRWAGRYSQQAAQETEALLEQDFWDQIAVRCPTLVARGQWSDVFSREKMLRLADLIGEAMVAEVPAADHRVTQDHPEFVAALIDAFVSSLVATNEHPADSKLSTVAHSSRR